MKKLALVALVTLVVLAGCLNIFGGEPLTTCEEGYEENEHGLCVSLNETAPTPEPTPTPTPTPEPTPTPVPDPYHSVEVGQSIEKGDFMVTIVSVGMYNYTSPFGEELRDYRVDLRIRNSADTEEEYRFGYILMGEDVEYDVRWHSTLYEKGLLQPGEVIEGMVLYDVGGEEGPFKLQVKTYSLAEHDYMNVIGKNSIEKPVVGVINYGDVCGESALGEEYLGDLLGTAGCDEISSARDWFNYPSWIEDGVVITRLKAKNHGDEPVTVLIVNEVPDRFGITARDLNYTYEPIFLDDYHPAWFVKLGRNEIWLTQINYSMYLESSEVEAMAAPVVLPLIGL
ncbi:hypothetical protein ACFLQ2_04000 [archaeon]